VPDNHAKAGQRVAYCAVFEHRIIRVTVAEYRNWSTTNELLDTD
jgi:hypothetical protein